VPPPEAPPGDRPSTRSADWRWLLPNPRPRAIGNFGASRYLEAGIAALGGRSDAAAPAGCDLAVASNPSLAVLRAMWEALAPGGVCFTEWTRPHPISADWQPRRLRAAGFSLRGWYWPWPPPRRAAPRAWLPLDAPGAQHYALRARRSRAAPVVRLAWRTARALGLLAPVYAVAQKPPVAQPAGLERYARHGSGIERCSTLLLTSGPRLSNPVVALLFAEPSAVPNVVVKLPRVQATMPALRAEAAALRRLPADLDGVPRLVDWDERDDGLAALSQTPVLGDPLWRRVDRQTYRALALQMTDWLVRLAGRPARRPRAAWWSRLVEPVLDDAAAIFGRLVEPGAIARTRACLERVVDLPLVFEQRDCWSGNVLLDRAGRLGVLDWESAEPCGLPLVDLLYFLADLGFVLEDAYRRGSVPAAYRASLDARTLTGAVRQECVERYARALGLSPLEQRALRLLVWLPHAVWDAHQLGLSATPAALGRIRFLSLWQTELDAIEQPG